MAEQTTKEKLQEFSEWLGLKFAYGPEKSYGKYSFYAKMGEGQKASVSFGYTQEEAFNDLWDFIKKFYVVVLKD